MMLGQTGNAPVAELLVGEHPVIPDNIQANDLTREGIKALKDTKKKLESKINLLNQKEDQLSATIEQIELNRTKLLEKFNKSQLIIERADSLEEEISTLEKKKKSLTGKVKRLDVKKEKFNTEISTLSQNYDKLTKQKVSLEIEINTQQNIIQKNERNLRELTSDIEILKVNNKELAEENDELRENTNHYKLQSKQLEDDIAKLKKQLSSLHNEKSENSSGTLSSNDVPDFMSVKQ